MTILEILNRIVINHNRIAGVTVSGDNAILIGDTLKDMRMLAQELQAQIQNDNSLNENENNNGESVGSAI